MLCLWHVKTRVESDKRLGFTCHGHLVETAYHSKRLYRKNEGYESPSHFTANKRKFLEYHLRYVLGLSRVRVPKLCSNEAQTGEAIRTSTVMMVTSQGEAP